jgi:hypothetical protein
MKKILLLFLLAVSVEASCVPPPNTYDWEAQRWALNNIPNQGGTISASSYRAGTAFMQQVKWWDVRQSLGRVLLYLGDNTNAMLSPIIYDWSNSSVTNDDLIAFVAADYSETNGLTGNTTSKYLRPCKSFGLGLASFTSINNVHSAVYVRTASNEASYSCGYASAGNCSFGMPISYSGMSYIEINAVPPTDGVTDTNGIGFYLSTRVTTGSATNRTTYKNTTNIVTSATCNGALGSGGFIFHAFNSAGTITAYTSRTLCYGAVGFGIFTNRVAPYNIAVQNVQQAKGRKVP